VAFNNVFNDQNYFNQYLETQFREFMKKSMQPALTQDSYFQQQ
jgi:hypothetical protein